ncbi:hypothetical protein M9435_004566 [Picochlorum sp. BPE23]|nr:hypothetical protein M9435_004566 [Picochlorum sp. BPE23]
METKLSFDSRQKTLLLSGKTHFLHSSNIELKLNHILNTKSANIEVFGSLSKHIGIGDISTADSWSGDAVAELSHASFKVNDNMDLRVSLGMKGSINRGRVSQMQPVLRIEENCWSFTTDCKGIWHVDYLL